MAIPFHKLVAVDPRFVLLAGIMVITVFPAFSQMQQCPVNIGFSSGDISFWSAQTGLRGGGVVEDYPAPNTGVSTIPEYNLSNTGIQVIRTPTRDSYGGFSTVPTINGYTYPYSVKLGSTATSWDLQSTTSNPGGFRRSITYEIQVPPGPADVPYTMTYAYALVLENGTHNSDQQPMFKATLSTRDGVITCASPEYYLPTLNDAGGRPGGLTGATLDSAAALADGFTLSSIPFLSHAGVMNNNGTWLYDVWTKDWTEVTFDLSAYRGQTVTLTFEADNCTPGAHFAYAYVALRNSCAGLEISGRATACTGSLLTYSVPALANARYEWTVPAGWEIRSGANTHSIRVMPGNTAGFVTVHEQNSCADLRDTLAVTATPPTVAGRLTGDTTICAGLNSVPVTLQGARGNVLGWLSSADGVTWDTVDNTSGRYIAQNLGRTTRYVALVQNGEACDIDRSSEAVVTVDAESAGGALTPADTSVCAGQQLGSHLTLTGNTGSVVNWQFSYDDDIWHDFSPVNQESFYDVSTILRTTHYRTVVKNGICPADTSAEAATAFINIPFPRAVIGPRDTGICYGDSVRLTADVGIGTNYTWTPAESLGSPGAGMINYVPSQIRTTARPATTTDYIFTLMNAGCPNVYTDTFHVSVTPPVRVSAGNDTAVVAGQPLQLQAAVNLPSADIFEWTPATGLNFPHVSNPVALLNTGIDSITYVVKAMDEAGCYGEDSLTVAVFKTGTDIFVPTAFTPNGDGINDLLYPICVGIRQLAFFRVYDRWGRLVFHTNRIGAGWDGKVSGTDSPAGGFVYMAEGIDYTGKTIFKKGSVLLIR